MTVSSNQSACPLDCYDACEINYTNAKISATTDGYTQGFLCPHLNHYIKYETIQTPSYNGVNISMDEALKKLYQILSSTIKSDILHYRGSGNFALMQESTDHFFSSVGATLTEGTLCDGAGEAGIIKGRGSNKNMPVSEIEKSEVVIFWGRNPHTTSSHLLPIIKGKTIIVIDPVETKIAKIADLFIQIKPHTDLYLAMLIVRFLHINNECDEEYLEKYASEFEEYYELTQTIRIKATLDNIDVSLGEIGKIIELVRDKKVAIVIGVGIQKYADGADVIRAIDAIAVSLGLFAKEGCGVAYLGNSKENIVSPFNKKSQKISKVNAVFNDYKTVFIQGANPLSQMPDSQRVKNSISKCKNIIYFGLYENETSEVANLIIPAKTFLQKEDIRTSYSHHSMLRMHQQIESKNGISEYELTHFLCDKFDIDFKSQQHYLEHFKSFSKNINNTFKVTSREDIPYKNGFDTDDSEFLFLEEFDKLEFGKNMFHLITPKSTTSINSQFKREKYVYIHSSHNIEEGNTLEVSTSYGSVKLPVKYNNDLREDCILIYSGTKGVNNITSSKHSFDGKSAIYQENMVVIRQK